MYTAQAMSSEVTTIKRLQRVDFALTESAATPRLTRRPAGAATPQSASSS